MTHYTTLGLPRSATSEEVAARFKELSRLHHPDAGGDIAEYQALAQAYGALKNSALRKQYDAELDLTTDPCPRCGRAGRVKRMRGFSGAAEWSTCPECRGSGTKQRGEQV